jgi:hypothetical protein
MDAGKIQSQNAAAGAVLGSWRGTLSRGGHSRAGGAYVTTHFVVMYAPL